MVTILGDKRTYCDGISRRNFLKIGALAMAGITLPDLLRAEAATGKRLGHKAIINVYLCGGPPHQDMFDLKMDAPSEIRGEFKPIKTNVPGIEIGELFPKIAAAMDRFAVIRSLVGARDEHANPIVHSGYTLAERRKNHPAFGSIIAKAFGPVDKAVPPFVDIIPSTRHKPYSYPAEVGWLSRDYAAVRPESEGAGDMTLRGISLSRLDDRRRLLAAVDHFRASVDASPDVASADSITRQAFDILTSSRFAEALDVSKEDAKTLERYDKGYEKIVGDAAPCKNYDFLAARRLVEAGARCVTLGYGFWDFHGQNSKNMKQYSPHLDHAVSTLVADLHDRGMLEDVSVVVWGEFGRTPKINKDAGRDHWPAVSCALLAGGGMRTGQVIGSTTADGGQADERPIHYRDVVATLLHNVGFDVARDQVIDAQERPHYVLDGHLPIAELV